MTLPTTAPGYVALNGQVTPDGSRVYVLAYAQDAYTNPAETPRVFVFDATTVQANLTLLGYFDIADYPGCPINLNNPGACDSEVAGAIALDGKTLFFAGGQNLVVVPVPATLTPPAAAAAGNSSARPSAQTITPWPVNVH